MSALCEGSYKSPGTPYSYLVVKGNTATGYYPKGTTQLLQIEYGVFGEASMEIAEESGELFYNTKITSNDGKVCKFGVVSKDGLRLTMAGIVGVCFIDWITEEEVDQLTIQGDPMEAPPGPYKIQPHNVGRLVWITGAPGLGKSTSAQLLNKTAGWVYYEVDCFTKCRNPYIPPDRENPTIMASLQTPLQGAGLEARQEVCRRAEKELLKMLKGGDCDQGVAGEYYDLLCQDITRERARIGGDWVVAGVAINQEHRQMIRSRLGPDLVFIVLTMNQEEVRKRLMDRHNNQQETVNFLMSTGQLFTPAGAGEEQAVNIVVTKDNNKQDVVKKILEALG